MNKVISLSLLSLMSVIGIVVGMGMSSYGSRGQYGGYGGGYGQSYGGYGGGYGKSYGGHGGVSVIYPGYSSGGGYNQNIIWLLLLLFILNDNFGCKKGNCH